MLWMLIWTFTIYTLLLLPSILFYADGSAYDHVPDVVKSNYLDSYLGNLGYSSVQCASIPSQVGQLNLDCPYGKIGKFLDYGINPTAELKNSCINNDENRKCYPDADFIKTNLEGSIGESDHLFVFNGVNSLFADGVSPNECNPKDSSLFVQFTCEQSIEGMSEKYNQISLSAATSVFIALMFTISIRAQYQGGKI